MFDSFQDKLQLKLNIDQLTRSNIENKVRKIIKYFAILFFFSILVFINVNLHQYAEDDAYIHFRIAEHLIQFGQPYFNLNEPIFTTSSIIWTLFLAGLSIIPIDLPLMVAILNAIFVGIGGLLYAKISYESTGNPFLAWIIPLIYAGILMHSSIGLMETPLALLVVGYGVNQYIKGKTHAWFIFNLVIFIRLELVIFSIIFLINSVFRRNFLWKKVISYSFLGTIPFLTIEFLFFRTVIPNTITAKSIIYQLTTLTLVRNIFQNTLPNIQILKSLNPYWQIIYISLIMTSSVLVVLIIVRKLRDISTNHLFVMVGIIISSLYFIRGVLLFPWYIPLFLVPILIGVICIYCPKLSLPSVLFVILLSFPFILNLLQTTIAAAGHPYLYTGFETGARVRNYLEVGSNLYADYPNATLMTSEIGGLGYSFKGYIVDAAGLASPNALRFHPMDVPEERSSGDIGAIPVRFIEEIKPDLVISYDIFVESFLSSNAIDEYVQIKKPLFLPQDLVDYGSDSFWSSNNLNVFYRKDFMLSSINNTE